MMSALNVLILGGTADALRLAHALSERVPAVNLTTALAGVTEAPAKMPGRVVSGPLGGTEGLSDFIRQKNIHAVIDATHPFAATISENAVTACAATTTPRLRLQRPAWLLPPTAKVHRVADFAAAADHLKKTSKRAFLTIGRKHLSAFAALETVHLVVRVLPSAAATQAVQPLTKCTAIFARPPFSQADEEQLLRRHAIDTLVSKDSGGDATRAKIDAALELAVPIVLIRRPAPPPGDVVDTVEEALNWLAET